MKNQLMAEFTAMKQNQLVLEKMLRKQQEFLTKQQAELASLREALAHKQANRPARPALPATPVGPARTAPTVTAAHTTTAIPARTPDTSRRKMLKRMGLAVLAGGAALGITAATYSPAEARISVNPTTNVGAVITRTGASIINIPTTPNFGLLVSPDSPSFNASSANLSGYSSVGISSLSSGDANSVGVLGSNNNSGTGVEGYSFSGTGVFGYSDNYTGVFGWNHTADQPAIVANNDAASNGIALQIAQGGLSVFGAGIGTSTCAFVHHTTSGVGGNTTGDFTKIDNPLCNNRPDALLFVTPNLTPNGASGISENKIVGVFYSSGFWNIYHQDTTPMGAGLYFNVLIINP